MSDDVRISHCDPIKGQDFVLRSLDAMLFSGRFPHAMLFSGLPGSGRFHTARHLMMRLNCEEADTPCGACRSCLKILRGNHPDFIRIAPLNGMIRIENIRELLGLLVRKPNEARMRLVLLEDAENMNREAANALLKILEEPPPSSFFILLSKAPQLLLETIRSRCQELRFRPPSEEEIIRKLAGIPGDENSAKASTRLSAGDLDQAECFAKNHAKRKMLAQFLAENSATKPAHVLMASEALAKDKKQAEISLDMLAGMFRDLLLVCMAPELLKSHGFSCDCTEEIRKAAKKFTPETVLKTLEKIHATRQALLQNALPRLSMEALFFTLMTDPNDYRSR